MRDYTHETRLDVFKNSSINVSMRSRLNWNLEVLFFLRRWENWSIPGKNPLRARERTNK